MTPSPIPEAAFVLGLPLVFLLQRPKYVYQRAKTGHNVGHLKGRKQCVKP
jgi:hypothetical protein